MQNFGTTGISPLNLPGFGICVQIEAVNGGRNCKQSKESLINARILASYSADVADSGCVESLDIRAIATQG